VIALLRKFLLFLAIFHAYTGYMLAVSSVELIEKSKEYDQQTVSYFGEVVGEVMIRKDYAWINVYDGSGAIGIWSPAGLVKNIMFGGSYKYRGDRIVVTGVLNRACRQHGGDLDIHAQEISIIKRGHEIYRPFNRSRFKLAIVLSGISLILLGLNLYLKKKRRIPTE